MTPFDLADRLHTVTRVVTRRDHLGQPARVLVASRTYPTSPEDLWDALTSPERIVRWFLPISGDLRLGGRYQLEGNAEGEITRCEPPTRLHVTWEFGGQVSWVAVTLSEVPEGARLELEHVAHVPDEWWVQYGPGATGVGWELAFLGLALHLRSGEAVDRAAAEAWPTTPEGRATIAGLSAGWADASVAGGEDPQAAKEAADRTTAFYTGA